MKKRNLMKKVMVFGMSMMISVGCMSSVYAADDMLKCDTDISKIVTSEDAALIDAKISEINMYKHKIRMLEKDTNLNDEDRLTQIEEIQSKIEMIDKEIEDLGAERPSEELLEELITTSCGNTMARSVWHPSELIEQFDGGYDVRGYICFGEI